MHSMKGSVASETTTPQINDTIGWMMKKIIVPHVQYAFKYIFLTLSAKPRRGIFKESFSNEDSNGREKRHLK